MKKYFLLFLMLLVFSNILLYSQSSFTNFGSGTENDPYQLWTKEHLIELTDSVYNDFYDLNQCWHCNKYFRLMQNIDSVTYAIGFGSFKPAYFHGGGYTITADSSVKIISPPFISVGPLFSSIGGCIDSLTLNGNIVIGFEAIGLSGIFRSVGILGTVSNCTNNVDALYSGIAYLNYGTIINCINNGNVASAGITIQNNYKVISCINTGTIFNTVSTATVGGIVSSANNGHDCISNCINLGSVTGGGSVGGIIGSLSGGGTGSPVC